MNPKAYEFLLETIAVARAAEELTRLQTLARANYHGRQLEELETEIAIRRGTLADPTADE